MDKVTPAVPAPIAQLVAAFSQPEPIRRGLLYERRMKCGQATCACQDDPKAAHGPYFTLTQKVGGKTRSRYIPRMRYLELRKQGFCTSTTRREAMLRQERGLFCDT